MTDIQLSPGAAGGEANDAFGVTAATISPRKMAFKRYVNHRGALVSTIVLAIIVIFVALAPITARYGVDEIIFKAEAGKPNSNLPPSSLAWFGTTSNGYDLYSRMKGGRIGELGVLQPIVVRPTREDGEQAYELVMGERRWRATQRARARIVLPRHEQHLRRPRRPRRLTADLPGLDAAERGQHAAPARRAAVPVVGARS